MKHVAIVWLVLFLIPPAHGAGIRDGGHGTVAGQPSDRRLSPPRTQEFDERSIVTPSEFAPADELQMTEDTFEIVGDSLVGTVENTATIVVLTPSSSHASAVRKRFAELGGDPAHLRAWVADYNSLWYQDYGPIYSIEKDDGASGHLVINDFVYDRFGRGDDDAVPEKIAKNEGIRDNPVTMNYEGGNFISDGTGRCLASSRIYEQNPQLKHEQVDALMKANLGCQTLIILAPLEDDYTHHIDLFAKLLDQKTILVGDFVDHARNKKIMDENARILTDTYGYRVVRTPVRSRGPANYLSHLNTFTINGYALIPAYDIPEDQVAARVFADAGFKPLLVPATQLENTGGAIHCILRSRPRI